MPKRPISATQSELAGRSVKRARGDRLRAQTQTDRIDRERVLEEIFRVVLNFAIDLQIPHDRAARVFTQARRRVGVKPYQLSDARHVKDLVRLGDALTTWYTEPEYLDSRGAPAALPLTGKKSVASLFSKFVPEAPAADTVSWLLAEGVLRERGAGRVVPTRRMITFAKANALMLDRIPFLLQGLLSTFTHNLEAKAVGGDTHCEHMLAIDDFPLSEVPRFSWEVKRLAPMLLDQLEAWAAPYVQRAAGEGARTARVGVEIFSYAEKRGGRVKRRPLA